MPLPQYFLSQQNFQLAFDRILRGQNPDYKRFFRPYLHSYSMSSTANVADLIKDIRTGRYRPQRPTMVYVPKKSGILRPLALLCLKDLIVYQAIVNCVADRFFAEQQTLAGRKAFGAIYNGPGNEYFFKPWQTGYKWFNKATAKAFHDSQNQLAEFDLVSFYELINHDLLCEILSAKVQNKDLLEFLGDCLRAWTASTHHGMLSHGIPQGPEASAFLAECVLLSFDREPFAGLTYLRYIDDIRLLSDNTKCLKRALVKLDLLSKSLGLVPQAQKIEIRKIDSLTAVQKTSPSLIPLLVRVNPKSERSQEALRKMFAASLLSTGTNATISDITGFRYCLLRLNPDVKTLKRIGELLTMRPDCSPVLSAYLKKFPKNKTSADTIFRALDQDPIFDAAAADYIEALDTCEPAKHDPKYDTVVNEVQKRSLEHSILLQIACLTYRLSRVSLADALQEIKSEENSLVKAHLISKLFGTDDGLVSAFQITDAFSLLKSGVKSKDEDYSRFCAAMLADQGARKLPTNSSFVANLLFHALGLSSKRSKKPSVLRQFFREQYGLQTSINWNKALGTDLRDAERRCIRSRRLAAKDATAYVLITDTLNEVLIQSFSLKNPALAPAYKSAAGKNKHPDFGNWLTNGSFIKSLPLSAPWFQQIHNARVKGDLAHAKQKGGKSKGTKTEEITWTQVKSLMKSASAAYAELLSEWGKIAI